MKIKKIFEDPPKLSALSEASDCKKLYIQLMVPMIGNRGLSLIAKIQNSKNLFRNYYKLLKINSHTKFYT